MLSSSLHVCKAGLSGLAPAAMHCVPSLLQLVELFPTADLQIALDTPAVLLKLDFETGC